MQSLLKIKNIFVLTPSLEYAALVKIAITLWRDDVKKCKKRLFPLSKGSWQEIEDVVVEKSSKLALPEILKNKLLDIIVPVGLQILSWVEFHKYIAFVSELPDMFIWTPLGTIDNRRTAKILVKGRSLDILERFKLACFYCLEGEIRDLWESFDLYERRYSEKFKVPLRSFWSEYLKEDWNELRIYESNLISRAFQQSAGHGNEAAIRYFFRKLNRDDVNNFIVKIARGVASLIVHQCTYFNNVRYSGVLLFLLSTMNAQQQAELFKTDTYAVLKCLLVWPGKSLFLETANDNWDSLSEENYSKLLEYIVDLMDNKQYLHKLFGKFWEQSPETYKQFFIAEDCGRVLLKLCRKENEKSIQLILKDTSLSVRQYVIFRDRVKEMYQYMIYREKWDSVKFLIQECISSREEMIKFRDESRMWRSGLHQRFEYPKDSQWDQFFQLVEDCILTYNKRKCIEDKNASSKMRSKDIYE